MHTSQYCGISSIFYPSRATVLFFIIYRKSAVIITHELVVAFNGTTTIQRAYILIVNVSA